MTQRGIAVVLVGLLLLAGDGQAFVFYDSVSDAKRTIEFIWMQTAENSQDGRNGKNDAAARGAGQRHLPPD